MSGSIRNPPRRNVRPTRQDGNGPPIAFIGVTRRARVRDSELFSLDRRNEAKSVGRDEIIFDGLFNVRHVASRTLMNLVESFCQQIE
jgi:hypothetical protein